MDAQPAPSDPAAGLSKPAGSGTLIPVDSSQQSVVLRLSACFQNARSVRTQPMSFEETHNDPTTQTQETTAAEQPEIQPAEQPTAQAAVQPQPEPVAESAQRVEAAETTA